MISGPGDLVPCITPSGAFWSMQLKRYVTGLDWNSMVCKQHVFKLNGLKNRFACVGPEPIQESKNYYAKDSLYISWNWPISPMQILRLKFSVIFVGQLNCYIRKAKFRNCLLVWPRKYTALLETPTTWRQSLQHMLVPFQCAAWANSILRWTSVCKTEKKQIALGFVQHGTPTFDVVIFHLKDDQLGTPWHILHSVALHCRFGIQAVTCCPNNLGCLTTESASMSVHCTSFERNMFQQPAAEFIYDITNRIGFKDCQPCLLVTMPLILILVALKMQQILRAVGLNLPVLQSNLHPKWLAVWGAWIWTMSFAWILQRMEICPKLLQMAKTETESYWPWKNHVVEEDAKDISTSSSCWLFVWHFGLWVKLAKTICYLALCFVW